MRLDTRSRDDQLGMCKGRAPHQLHDNNHKGYATEGCSPALRGMAWGAHQQVHLVVGVQATLAALLPVPRLGAGRGAAVAAVPALPGGRGAAPARALWLGGRLRASVLFAAPFLDEDGGSGDGVKKGGGGSGGGIDRSSIGQQYSM